LGQEVVKLNWEDKDTVNHVDNLNLNWVELHKALVVKYCYITTMLNIICHLLEGVNHYNNSIVQAFSITNHEATVVAGYLISFSYDC
jgi:hypothetical protein